MAAGLALVSASAAAFVHAHGWTLYYGDADAHLMIARRIVDAQNSGYDQVGSVWLPLLHVLMLPFVRVDAWWRNGLAGAIPPAICFVIAGSFLFVAARRAFESTAPAAAAAALFALNPNILYLQSIPMTEAVFFACLAALLYFTVVFRQSRHWAAAAAAGAAATAGALTRYDGWFVIPFAAAYFLVAAKRYRLPAALVFCALAVLGPLYWIAHNWWATGDWLDFYRGPYSASAIQGSATYPGLHDWRAAWLYYRTAVELCSGPLLAILGLAGIIACAIKKVFWPIALLALPPIFYLANMHSGASPILVPQLPPHSYYNTRYGTAALPLFAFAAAGLAAIVPQRLRAAAAVLIVAAGAGWWLVHPRPSDWITWEESRVNSEGRRAWTNRAADYLEPRYHPGVSVITSFYPLTGIFREMGIPLRETLIGDNGIPWLAAVERPELFLTQDWAIVEGGDQVQSAINRLGRFGIRYTLEKQIAVKDQPVIEIYRRHAPTPSPEF